MVPLADVVRNMPYVNKLERLIAYCHHIAMSPLIFHKQKASWNFKEKLL